MQAVCCHCNVCQTRSVSCVLLGPSAVMTIELVLLTLELGTLECCKTDGSTLLPEVDLSNEHAWLT